MLGQNIMYCLYFTLRKKKRTEGYLDSRHASARPAASSVLSLPLSLSWSLFSQPPPFLPEGFSFHIFLSLFIYIYWSLFLLLFFVTLHFNLNLFSLWPFVAVFIQMSLARWLIAVVQKSLLQMQIKWLEVLLFMLLIDTLLHSWIYLWYKEEKLMRLDDSVGWL